MISRSDAATIALGEARAQGLGFAITNVLSVAELRTAPPNVYAADLSNCWIAYVELPGPLRLCSSTIVAVDRATGRVIYSGSAGDEG
jgi:hypothetical protein